ncbi:MAG: hypothetical protein RLZZ58_318 [Pseudomonadota bacterium]
MPSPRKLFLQSALAALCLTAASSALADVKAGVDAWERGDYPTAVAEWRPLAIAGDPDAQFNLGQAYKLGRGVPVDLSQAETWYRRAADQGHLQAEDNLGLVMFSANKRNDAMPYIVRAAARGEPRAQYVLGTAHFNGDLAARDWPRAYALTKRASDAGLQIASARLTQLDRLIPLEQRQEGLELTQDMERTEQQARLAAIVNAPKPKPGKPAATQTAAVRPMALPPSQPGVSYVPPPILNDDSGEVAPPRPVRAPASTAPIRTAELPASTPGADYGDPPEFPEGVPVGTAGWPASGPAPAAPVAAAETPRPAPAPAAVKRGAWRAQLGAFGDEARARALWTGLERKYPSFGSAQPYLVKAGAVTRLQAGDFASRTDAENFCAKVRPGGQACLVVAR